MALSPEQLTLVGLMLAVGAAGLAKKWVFGWVYDALKVEGDQRLADMTADRNLWRDIALKALQVNDKAIEVAAKKTNGG